MTYTQWEEVIDECAFLTYCGEAYYKSGYDKSNKKFEFTSLNGKSKLYTTFEDALRNSRFSITY